MPKGPTRWSGSLKSLMHQMLIFCFLSKSLETVMERLLWEIFYILAQLLIKYCFEVRNEKVQEYRNEMYYY